MNHGVQIFSRIHYGPSYAARHEEMIDLDQVCKKHFILAYISFRKDCLIMQRHLTCIKKESFGVDMALLKIEEPQTSGHLRLTGYPLWRLGFRPFYLLAAAFAALAVPLWVARYFGHAAGLLHADMNWHMHEMLFGFAIAVIVGFLYTAARNWTGRWTPRHGHLAALTALWLAGRLAMLFAPPMLAAFVDIPFLPLAAWPLYRVLKRAGNRRNLFLPGLLGLLTLINVAFHCAVLGWLDIAPMRAIEAGILVVVVIESVIGGRVIPMFTANAVKDAKPVMRAGRDRISIVLIAMASLAWVFLPLSPLTAALNFAAACSQSVRLAGWKSHLTWRNPLLWILHLSYAWIVVGFFLLSLSALGLTPSTAAFHSLAVGSMGGLVIGMITRTALGHTGRPLKAGTGETAAYVLIQLGVASRLCAAFDVLGHRNGALFLAAACWSAAFLLYLVIYGPYLFRPRIDGKEG